MKTALQLISEHCDNFTTVKKEDGTIIPYYEHDQVVKCIEQVSIATAEKDAEIRDLKMNILNMVKDHGSELDRLKSLVPEWVSVKDRLPETECLLLTASKKIITGDWYNGVWRSAGKNRWEEKITGGFELTSSLRKSDVTHWMYLPQHPKAE